MWSSTEETLRVGRSHQGAVWSTVLCVSKYGKFYRFHVDEGVGLLFKNQRSFGKHVGLRDTISMLRSRAHLNLVLDGYNI